jgi:hypothetical protein
MNLAKFFLKADSAKFALCALLLLSFAGCVAEVEGPPGVETSAGVQDDYVYYPNYEVYYSSSRHQYAYREGNAWVSRPAPRGISVDALRASPSVQMDFHDAPANHHAAVVQQYPKNWAPSGSKQGQDDNRKDGQRDGHADNSGK